MVVRMAGVTRVPRRTARVSRICAGVGLPGLLIRGTGASPDSRQRPQDPLPQGCRHGRHRSGSQRLGDFVQLLAIGPGFGRALQQGSEFHAPGFVDDPVEFVVQQFDVAWKDHVASMDAALAHAVSTPCAHRCLRKTWRAVCSRDFTVFSGTCRMLAISS
jgi:hypothetical protein